MSDDNSALEVPTSDPFEEVFIPGYSQRDETRVEVEAHIESLLEKGRQREARLTQLETATQNFSQLGNFPPPGIDLARPHSRSPSRCTTAKKRRVACATCTDDRTDLDLDLDLLQLQCNDLEAECDRAKDESASLREECDRLKEENAKLEAELHQYKVSIAFFRKETGRWRWAAANARTRLDSAMQHFGIIMEAVSSTSIQSAMQEFGVAMVAVSGVLRNPASE
ncbi:hypothetical protein DFH07DRAFT_766012 [Mycena maculata]|uniref:Uncharacterized protein n=1 Tax=Mycena maculata TaxID=230809 RepID=A0AAD7K7R4_9AGAR|nr:hypothetical protein DFH07DRAFT_766012 [Mycena maculata]